MREGATILLTTQYLEEADKLADRIAVLDNGKIIAEGTANQLKNRVGKERLDLIIDKKSSFEKAADALEGDDIRVNEQERRFSIPVDDPVKEIKKILDQMEKAEIEIESMLLHKPTLDDVFMKLTGHAAEDKTTK